MNKSLHIWMAKIDAQKIYQWPDKMVPEILKKG